MKFTHPIDQNPTLSVGWPHSELAYITSFRIRRKENTTRKVEQINKR